jgi:glycogen synthase
MGNNESVLLGCFQCEAVDPADVTAIATTVEKALATYDTPVLKEMIQNCMAQDLSWKVSMILCH